METRQKGYVSDVTFRFLTWAEMVVPSTKVKSIEKGPGMGKDG